VIPARLSARILGDLQWKYARLLELRRQREAWIAQGVHRVPAELAEERRRSFRALARRFPGALKELDTRSLGELQEIASWVEAAGAGQLDPTQGPLDPTQEQWLHVIWSRHLFLRLALLCRRWARRLERRTAGSGSERAAAFYAFHREIERRLRGRGGELAWSMDAIAERCGVHPHALLELCLHPPGGRLAPWVDRALPLPTLSR
jgi:hypothetical protein